MDIHNFFDLENFFHKDLFANTDNLWSPLTRLNEYLSKPSFQRELQGTGQGAFISSEAIVSVGEGSVIEPGVFIDGVCVIGKHTRIRSGAYIRGNVIIGDRCVIGHGTEVKHSIFLNDAHAPHFSYVGDSIIGNRVNIGASSICSNLRLDKKDIIVRIDGEKISTGLKKLGSIIGDGVQIGSKCIFNPGTVVGKETQFYPGLILAGTYKEKSLIKKGLIL